MFAELTAHANHIRAWEAVGEDMSVARASLYRAEVETLTMVRATWNSCFRVRDLYRRLREVEEEFLDEMEAYLTRLSMVRLYLD